MGGALQAGQQQQIGDQPLQTPALAQHPIQTGRRGGFCLGRRWGAYPRLERSDQAAQAAAFGFQLARAMPAIARANTPWPSHQIRLASHSRGARQGGQQLAAGIENPQLQAGWIGGADGMALDQSIGHRARLTHQKQARQHRRQCRKRHGH